MRVLIPELPDDARPLAAAIAAAGHTVIATPVIAFAPIEDATLNLTGAQGFLVTSPVAARALAARVGVRTFPVFADCAATAAALADLGFRRVEAATDAQALARLVEARLTPALGALIHPCARGAPSSVVAALTNAGFAVRAVALYDLTRVDALPAAARDALTREEIAATLVMTAEAARAFATIVQRESLSAYATRLSIIATSISAAAPVQGLKPADVVVTGGSAAELVAGLTEVSTRRGARAEAARQVAEDAARRRAEEEARAQAEAAQRAAEEQAARERAAAEAAGRKAEDEARAADEARRRAEAEARAAAEAAQRAAEEQAARERAAAEAARRKAEDEARAADEARRRAEAEARARTEAAQRAAEEQAARERAAADAARRKAEDEARAADEARRRAEAEARAQAEAAQRAAEEQAVRERAAAEAARRKAEDDARAADEARRRAEAEARAQAEAAQRAAEEQAVRERAAADAARRKAEDEARAADEARRRAEAEARARTEAAQRAAEEEAARKRVTADAARRKVEEDARAEAARRAEEQAAAERAAAEAERRKADEARAEAARRKAEEQARAEAARRQAAEDAEEKARAESRRVAEAARAAEAAAAAEQARRIAADRARFAERQRIAQAEALARGQQASAGVEGVAPETQGPEVRTDRTGLGARVGQWLNLRPPSAGSATETIASDALSPSAGSDTLPLDSAMDERPDAPESPPPAGDTVPPRSMARAARLQAEDAADAAAQRARGYEPLQPDSAADPTAEAQGNEPAGSAPAPRRLWRALLLLVIVAGIGALALTIRNNDQRLTTLPASELTEPPAVTSGPVPEVAALNARIAALEQRPAGPDAAAIGKLIDERLAAMPQGSADGALDATVGSQAQQLAAVTARVANLEATLGNAARLDELTKRLDNLEGKSADAAAVLSLSERVAGLEAIARSAVEAQTARVALLLALGQWREALMNGRPFALEFESVRALSARAGTELGFDPAGFSGRAASGLATSAMLRNRFDETAAAVLRAAARPEGSDGWFARTFDRMLSIITIRRVDGLIEGNTPSAILARAGAHLRDGNLPAAVTEMDALTGAAAGAAQTWLEEARARVSAEQALADASTRAIAALGAAPAVETAGAPTRAPAP